ncbi:MAG: putative Glycosyl transferase family 2 [Nitrospirae bacterium]|nr:putative Glycosyl transferase family 2 [Nitrospirota bacterium]
MTKLLSIIIVNFRTADMLWDCIKSISEQNVDSEIIIVDNNSGDHDRDVLEVLRTSYPFVTLILNNVNHGFSKANNQALAASSGEYVLFLNPDTLLFPLCLDRLLSFIKTVQGVGCFIPKLWMDKEKTFLMPPSYLPSLWETVQNHVSMSSDLLLSLSFKRWLRKALAYWNADTPLPVEAISGAYKGGRAEALLLPRCRGCALL